MLSVAGHICVDITPRFDGALDGAVFVPGSLYRVGPAVITNGGVVANTGLAMHRFGNRIAAVAKVGPDELGNICRAYMHRFGLDGELVVADGLSTSYTIVVAPPGSDRLFLQYPGANDRFVAADVREELLARARLLHVGYPSLMEGLYRDAGRELYLLLSRAKERGAMTSLDMAFIDPRSEAAIQDWLAILRRLGPVLDIFLPSYDELFEMVDLPGFLGKRAESLSGGRGGEGVCREHVRTLARIAREAGIGVVGVKCGLDGIYLTTGDRVDPFGTEWRRRELWAESLDLGQAASTTGAGDCAYAGFLTAALRGMGPEDAVLAACVAGAQNVRAVDAYSGLGDWQEVLGMIEGPLPRHELSLGSGWRRGRRRGLWHGPDDGSIS